MPELEFHWRLVPLVDPLSRVNDLPISLYWTLTPDGIFDHVFMLRLESPPTSCAGNGIVSIGSKNKLIIA